MNQNPETTLDATTLKRIEDARDSSDEYSRAYRILREEMKPMFPTNRMAVYVAKMFAACRLHPEVRSLIGDKMEDGFWLVTECYANNWVHPPKE